MPILFFSQQKGATMKRLKRLGTLVLLTVSIAVMNACGTSQEEMQAIIQTMQAAMTQTQAAIPTNTVIPLTPTVSNDLSAPKICTYENIIFIGGSITAGAGASENSKTYANRVGQWFIDRCSNEINIKNISIGGTGSDFAVYRLEHDVDGFIPDIAFYEFALNDGGRPPDYIQKYVEALLYKLKRMNSSMIIFSILTTRESHMDFYKNGVLPPEVDAHMQVASANNIPVINVGQHLWNDVMKNGSDIRQYYSDGVHPNDLGYEYYYETVIQFLESYFNMPAEQYNGDLANATLIDMSGVESIRCEKINENNEVRLLCDKEDTFSTSFTGDVLGMVGRIQSDGGRLECVVDNSTKETLDFWDEHALSYERTSYFLSFTGLENKKHDLRCTVLDEIISSKAGRSRGYSVEVLYFMVNPESEIE
jgi:lysophospholipase L1-like esterase